MKKRHTKKQIIEAIKHWENILKSMNEAEDQLLQALSDELGKSKLFSKTFKTGFNEDFFRRCYDILNEHFFSSKLDKIPVYYKSDTDIRKFLINRNADPRKIPECFFGDYSVILDNDLETFKLTDDLILHDDVILLNANHIQNKSLIFAIACLCHEMIHYYDRLFGEYCDFTKFAILNKTDVNTHNTFTFEDMKDRANDLGINVIQDIPKNKDVKTLDKEAIELLMNKVKHNDPVNEAEKQFITDNPNTFVTFYENGKGGCITTF